MTLAELEKTPLTVLTGVGPKVSQSYLELGIKTLSDLIFMKPKGYEDKRNRVCIGCGSEKLKTNTIVQVKSKSLFGKRACSLKAVVVDTQNGARGELLGFNRSFLSHVLFEGCYYRLYASQLPYSGKGPYRFSEFEIVPVPEDSVPEGNGPEFAGTMPGGGISAVYRLGGILTQKTVRQNMKQALSMADCLENNLPGYLYSKYGLLSRDEAVRKIHFPETEQDIEQALHSLAFSEVFFMQLYLSGRTTSFTGRSVPEEPVVQERLLIENLPFDLTADQTAVLDEIRKDMAGSHAMNRLLQGDVGAGKTLVAWIAALHAACNGRQVAFMAPTGLLARQHFQGAETLLGNLGLNIAFLDGQTHGKARREVLDALKRGEINIIAGTHALFSEDVEFADLGLVIIDEQHRFGVEQRKALAEKGQSPHLLLMSATPIPRTLASAVYGSLNVSSIRTMPSGRLPVKTFVVGPERREKMYSAVETELRRGHKAYFVVPRIEDEEGSDFRSVEKLFGELSVRYSGFRGEKVYGGLDEQQKAAVLNDFAAGKIRFLVATSVVEVGLDVPDATCMVVEHADTFGLAALHQLRGRVGRSTLQSWCFLVHDGKISEPARQRLAVLRRTNDGFEIAEEDLRLRGPGELSGLKQSGFANLKYASLEGEENLEMINIVREEIRNMAEGKCTN